MVNFPDREISGLKSKFLRIGLTVFLFEILGKRAYLIQWVWDGEITWGNSGIILGEKRERTV